MVRSGDHSPRRWPPGSVHDLLHLLRRNPVGAARWPRHSSRSPCGCVARRRASAWRQRDTPSPRRRAHYCRIAPHQDVPERWLKDRRSAKRPVSSTVASDRSTSPSTSEICPGRLCIDHRHEPARPDALVDERSDVTRGPSSPRERPSRRAGLAAHRNGEGHRPLPDPGRVDLRVRRPSPNVSGSPDPEPGRTRSCSRVVDLRCRVAW